MLTATPTAALEEWCVGGAVYAGTIGSNESQEGRRKELGQIQYYAVTIPAMPVFSPIRTRDGAHYLA